MKYRSKPLITSKDMDKLKGLPFRFVRGEGLEGGQKQQRGGEQCDANMTNKCNISECTKHILEQ